MDNTTRIEKVQAQLRRKKLDALIISEPHNRRYLCGYSAMDHDIGESSGILLVPARTNPILLTDFRYQIQAEQEAGEIKVMLYPKGLLALLKTVLPDMGVQKLAFESHYTLHSVAGEMEETFKKLNISLHPLTDLVEEMRIVKDEEEISKLRKSVLLNEEIGRAHV